MDIQEDYVKRTIAIVSTQQAPWQLQLLPFFMANTQTANVEQILMSGES